MSTRKADVTLGASKGFARCPHCRNLIDASSTACRFCKVPLDAAALQAAAAAYRQDTDTKSRNNDRRALLAGIASLIAGAALAALMFGRRMMRARSGSLR
jgi:hypothetical protein